MCGAPTQVRPTSAVYIVTVVAVLPQVFRVRGIEGQAVAAGLEGCDAALARVVLVAGAVVGVEAELVGTLPGAAPAGDGGGLLGSCGGA